jgi:NTE family protein
VRQEIIMNQLRSTSSSAARKVALALRGGGSHGAFTWGVLDRMLEDETIEIIGITGTSAGAMNAVVLADGMVRGGPERARKELRQFWEAIGKMVGFNSFLIWPMSGETAASTPLEYNPLYMAFAMLSRNLSPYDLNPLNYNPLRDLLSELIDFDGLRAQKSFEVMICATNIRTAMRRLFHNADISVDAVLASACLPQMMSAVEIDGESYWDGGFTGNPAVTGLLRRLPKCDLIVVRIDPVHRDVVPRRPADIIDRLLEVSFNSTFWLELSALGFLSKLIEEGHLDRARFGRFLFHAIEASSLMEKLPASSKANNYPAMLEYLFNLGRQTADAWFARHGSDIGNRSTFNLQKLLPVDF